jgi:hypothetical protein
VRQPRGLESSHGLSITKIRLLMLFSEIAALYYKNYTKNKRDILPEERKGSEYLNAKTDIGIFYRYMK